MFFDLCFSYSDIIIGSLYTKLNKKNSNFYKSTIFYLNDEIIYCLKIPPPYPRWLYIFLFAATNNKIVYFLMFFIFIISIGLAFLLSGYEQYKMDIYRVFLLIFGNFIYISSSITMKYCIQSNRMKLFTIYAIFCMFMLTNIYLAMFYNTILKPKYPSKVKTIDEIYQMNRKIVTTLQLSVKLSLFFVNFLLIGFSYFQKFVDHSRNIEIGINEDFLNRISNDNDIVFMVSKIYLKSKKLSNNIYCIEDKQRSQLFITMFIENNLFNEYPFNNIIQYIIEAGIIEHWKSLAMIKYKNVDNYVYEMNMLTLDDLSGAFVMLMIGTIVSCTIFLFECYVFRKCKTNVKHKQLWIFFSKIIDSNRYIFVR